MGYVLPGYGQADGENIEKVNTKVNPYQIEPLLNTYSPRLFGAPPQLTNLCDMRLSSSVDNIPGPVGDYYLTKILRDSQVANFCVGRALFTGGINSYADIIRLTATYGAALKKYNIYDKDGTTSIRDTEKMSTVMDSDAALEAYKASLGDDDYGKNNAIMGGLNLSDGINTIANQMSTAFTYAADLSAESDSLLANIASILGDGALTLLTALKESARINQPFYTFESDWATYINNVKTMINAAVVMLGLQGAYVRIGDQLLPIGTDVKVKADTDVWSLYRPITTDKGTGVVTSIDTMSGDVSQYVSFMIDNMNMSESYTNSIGQSSLFGTMNEGIESGAELAFITNSTPGKIDDEVIKMVTGAQEAANKTLSSLSSGVGRFTASILSGMVSSYLGDHTVYPDIFKGATANESMTFTCHLVASGGDPYSYLTEILVPLFFALGLVLPQMSATNNASYSFPPIVQCNIPGVWGTRLGMVQSITVTKNPNGKDYSINGYPLAVDLSITVQSLEKSLMTTGIDKPAVFLNNNTMFDYIAECAGVDKYRVNGAVRLVTKLALAKSAGLSGNMFYNIGNAVMNDVTSYVNKVTQLGRI